MFGGLLAVLSLPLMLASPTIQSRLSPVPPTPSIITAPTANSILSSQTTIVSGTTSAGSSVALTNNGQALATVTSDVNGAFQVQVVLIVGQNQLTVQASNVCGSSGIVSETVTVKLPSSSH